MTNTENTTIACPRRGMHEAHTWNEAVGTGAVTRWCAGRTQPEPELVLNQKTWEGAPCNVYTDEWGTIINLPEGHADLGYAPGSQFYGEPDAS